MNNVEIACSERGFELLHSVARRVRLRTIDTKTREKLAEIGQHLRKQPEINTVRINKETGSLVLFLAQDSISHQQLQKWLEPYGIVKEAKPQESLKINSQQTWERIQGLIPPLLGVTAVRGLGINGWGAIVGYVVATGIARQVMEQLGQGQPPKERNQKPQLNSLAPSCQFSYQIIHQLPGRIRLRIPLVQKDEELAKKLESLKQWDERIVQVQVNRQNASVVITYRSDIVSPDGKLPLDTSEIINLIQWASLPAEKQTVSQEKKVTSNSALASQNITIVKADEFAAEQFENNGHHLKLNEGENNLQTEGKQEEKGALEEGENDESNPPNSPPDCSEEVKESIDLQETGQNPHESGQTATMIYSSASELSESQSPLRRFKACMLGTMLKFMANMPIQPAKA